MMNIDILAIGAHPDDIELTCAGTLVKCRSEGASIGILDLTAGDLGTHGDPETRLKEAKASSRVLGLDFRENLGLPDGFLKDTDEAVAQVVTILRRVRPVLVMTSYEKNHHPDHIACNQIVKRAFWLSGVAKFLPEHPCKRPKALIFYTGKDLYQPDFIVDVSDFFETRLKAIKCYGSQLKSRGPRTMINDPEFLDWITARARFLGTSIGARYGEAFYYPQALPVPNPLKLWQEP
jgi:bacillithiol biosynthesis deacetylase BshB1